MQLTQHQHQHQQLCSSYQQHATCCLVTVRYAGGYPATSASSWISNIWVQYMHSWYYTNTEAQCTSRLCCVKYFMMNDVTWNSKSKLVNRSMSSLRIADVSNPFTFSTNTYCGGLEHLKTDNVHNNWNVHKRFLSSGANKMFKFYCECMQHVNSK